MNAERIANLLKDFKRDTCVHSDPTAGLDEVSAMELLRLGKPVVAYVFSQGVALDIHLMALLGKITGTDPVAEAHRGHLPEMREDWYAWAHNQGY